MTATQTPLLRDGTTVEQLVSENGTRHVLARILTDPELFELEQERVFGRTWNFVAHESELPSAGTFVTRPIGTDSVIVCRTRDDEFETLLNVCSHRGTQLCNVDRGSSETFRCPYHGWVYDNGGQFLGALAEKDAYPVALEKEKLGLRRARTAVYRGLVFATWSDDVPPLEEYLGDVAFYLDIVFGGSDRGMKVLGPPQRWVIPANWKIAADNFSTDSYHTLTTHRSVIDSLLIPDLDEVTANSVSLLTDPAWGHGVLFIKLPPSEMSTEEALVGKCVLSGLTPDSGGELRRNLTADHLALMDTHIPGIGTVFPNFAYLKGAGISELETQPSFYMTIRVFAPLGPDSTEIWSWSMVHRDATVEIRDAARRNTLRMFGSSGMIEQDDGEIWSRIQRGVSGPQGKRSILKYPSTRDPDPSWPWPGVAYDGYPTEDTEWSFFRRWRDLIRRDGT